MISILTATPLASPGQSARKPQSSTPLAPDPSASGSAKPASHGADSEGADHFQDVFSSVVHNQPSQKRTHDSSTSIQLPEDGQKIAPSTKSTSPSNIQEFPKTNSTKIVSAEFLNVLRGLSTRNEEPATLSGSNPQPPTLKKDSGLKIDSETPKQDGAEGNDMISAGQDALGLFSIFLPNASLDVASSAIDNHNSDQDGSIQSNPVSQPAVAVSLTGNPTPVATGGPVVKMLQSSSSPSKDSEVLSFGLILTSKRPAEPLEQKKNGPVSTAAASATSSNGIADAGSTSEPSEPESSQAPVSIASLLGLNSDNRVAAQQNRDEAKRSIPAVSWSGASGKGSASNPSEKTTHGESESSLKSTANEAVLGNAAYLAANPEGVVSPVASPGESQPNISRPAQLSSPSSTTTPNPEPATGPAKELVVRLEGQSGEKISVRVADQGGQVQIAVRSSDPATAALLRQDLSSLTTTLEHAGWKSEVFTPSASASSVGAGLSNPAAMALPSAKSETSDQQNTNGSADWSIFDDNAKKRPNISELWDEILTRQGTYS